MIPDGYLEAACAIVKDRTLTQKEREARMDALVQGYEDTLTAPIPLSREERVALIALRRLVADGVIGPEA